MAYKDPTQFNPIFQQVWNSDLGQPGLVDPRGVENWVNALEGQYTSEFAKKNQRQPTDEEKETFLNKVITPATARGLINGTLNTIQIRENLAKPNLDISEKTTPPSTTTDTTINPEQVQGDLAKRYEDIYGRVGEALTERIRQSFVRPRQQLATQNAVLGRLRSPIAIPQEEALSAAEGTAVSQGLAGLEEQKAGGLAGLSSTIANIQERERRAQEQGAQFGQELGLRRQGLGLQQRQFEAGEENRFQDRLYGQRQFEQESSLAERLGRLQAEASKPGALDKSLAILSALGGVGSGLGSLIGGIASYRKSK